MNIAIISDKEGSAIWRLGEMNRKRLPHLNITHVCVHPKRPSQEQLDAAELALEQADVIDWHYWKSAVLLRKLYPAITEGKPNILRHTNEHNILDTEKNHWEWKDMQWGVHVASNKWQQAELKRQGIDSTLVRLVAEFDNFEYTPTLTDQKIVGMVGQIKKVKGVREVKKACDELGYTLMLIGSPSEAEYWDNLVKDGVMLHSKVPDAEIGALYNQMRAFVCNSDDGTESGTMPILEAMVAGIPVVTRRIGHVRDMGEHMKNMYIRTGKYTDIEDLKNGLRMIVENEDVSNQLREAAWRTVRQYHPDVMAREYERLYRRVLYPNQPTVSVIMSTYNRSNLLPDHFDAIDAQTYKNVEVVVCDDGSTDDTADKVEQARARGQVVVRYINTLNVPSEDGSKKYGLAHARNLGLIEAIGDIVVICDDRHRMDVGAIQAFVERLLAEPDKKIWLWGSKGVFKQFVENFSCTWRRTLIDGGMFNERMDVYGGMTQEVNNRFNRQGIKFEWVPQALAEVVFNTHSKSKHRKDIIKSKIRLYKMGFQ